MTLKRLLVVAAMLLAAASVQAQMPDEGYEARFSTLGRAYARNPRNVETLYQLAQFYFDNAHPLRSLPMAMRFVRMAEERQTYLLEENKVNELLKLQRNGITIQAIRELKEAITAAAVNTVKLRTDLSMEEIDSYLDLFGNDNPDFARLLHSRRYTRIFQETLSKGNLDDCYRFSITYPGTAEAEQLEARMGQLSAEMFRTMDATASIDSVQQRYPLCAAVARSAAKRKSRMAYDEADREGSIAAYSRFLGNYPASDESEAAREHIDRLLEIDLARRNTAMELAHFADSNADQAIADRALARLRRLIYVNHDVEAARYYVEHFKLDAFFSEVYSRYYSWHSVEGNGAPLQVFAAASPDFPFPRALEGDLERAEEIDGVPLMEVFLEKAYDRYSEYIKMLMGKAIAVVPMQRMLQPLLAARRWDDALFRLEQFEICFDNQWQSQYTGLQRLIATPTGRTLSREFATGGDVQHPCVNALDGRLYYSDGYRICRAEKRGGRWMPADTVVFTNTEATDLTLFGFYAGGRRMLLGSGGDIWVAEREGDQWRVSDIPPYPVNTDYVETDAYMLPDGSGMLLASDRPGGFNLQPSHAYFHGDTALASDLWFIPYTQDRWGTPVNLGLKVNTIYCERSPILSRNLKTLYFISDGHLGLGYGDVYMVERTDMEDWTSWGEPQNLGRDVNSGFREADLSFSPDERRVYLSSNLSDSVFSAYSFATSHSTVSLGETFSFGVGDLQQSLVRLQVADLQQQAVTQVVDYMGDADAVDLSLLRDRRYALLADAGTSFVTAGVVDAASLGHYRLPAYTFEELVAMDRPLPLPVVEFSADGSVLLPVAQLQLEQLARFLKQHPQAVAEFCVDVAGSDSRHCYALSLERGAALRDFMCGHGVAADRILVSAYGNVNVRLTGTSSVSVRFRE